MKLFGLFLALLLIFQFNSLGNCAFDREKQKVDQTELYKKYLNLEFTKHFDMYAGYVDASKSPEDNKFMYYWYVTQENTTLDRPANYTIIWMNGGPGCSSLEGATSEIGPFNFKPLQDGWSHEASINDFSWNKIANLVFLEFPFGVGFSSPTTGPQDDISTAQYNYLALEDLFMKYPELIKTEVYIMGESYAGVYIPQLALEIHKQNEVLKEKKIINLKGFAAGNPCTDPDFECHINNNSIWQQFAMLFEMGIISKDSYETWMDVCLLNRDINFPVFTQQCIDYEEKLVQHCGVPFYFNDAEKYGPFINYYDMFRACNPPHYLKSNGNFSKSSFQRSQFLQSLIGRQQKFIESNIKYNHSYIPISDSGYCLESTGMEHFFNDQVQKDEIRKLLKIYSENHPNITSKFVWEGCSGKTKFVKTNGSYWIYKTLSEMQDMPYKIMVYTGNTDLDVPITATRRWINRLIKETKQPIVQPMKKFDFWNSKTESFQNGGFFEVYEKFSFVEFQGAGHMVPQSSDASSLWVMRQFMQKDIYQIDDREESH